MTKNKTAAQRKAEEERRIFRAFAASAGIEPEPGTLRSLTPPRPDIRCRIKSSLHYFELGEITSQGIARGAALSEKTGKSSGGSFSQDTPFSYILRQKAKKNYRIRKAGKLELLLYYEKQYPPPQSHNLQSLLGKSIAQQMIQQGPWTRIWVYDNWKKRILWTYP